MSVKSAKLVFYFEDVDQISNDDTVDNNFYEDQSKEIFKNYSLSDEELFEKGYKNKNSLKLYIPKGNYFELPYKLHKFEIIDNSLQVIRSFEDNMN